MGGPVLLDAGVVTRCRRRVHLENDPGMADAPKAPPDPSAAQRIADAAAHRRAVADRLAAVFGAGWVEIPRGPRAEREAATLAALTSRAEFVWAAQLPADPAGGRRGTIDLLVRVGDGYVPVLVVRHKVADRGSGARTSELLEPFPARAGVDRERKVRPQPRDQLRLVHALRMLQAAGFAGDGVHAGVVGLDAEVVLWHDLRAPNWPGGRSALAEYNARFTDRLAVADAARNAAPALAVPSRIVECRGCPWWPVCERELHDTRDVSLVVRGEDAVQLRAAGVSTVDRLAALEPSGEPPVPFVGMRFDEAVLLARAWLRDLSVVRRVPSVEVARGDVEVDIDMESFGDAGAYLWGVWLSGADIGVRPGYHSFVTWDPLPTEDEGRSFGEFWTWLDEVRARVAARGLSFRAYCYNELAENRWLLASAERFAGQPGVPPVGAVKQFIAADEWIDLFRVVREQFLCAHGKGLKIIAPAAGFRWRDAEAGGENSMRWYRDAVGMEGQQPDLDQRRRLLEYNEDDVRATFTLRSWMSSPEVYGLPFAGDL